MNDEKLKTVRKTQLSLVKKALSDAINYSERFEQFYQDLTEISEKILDHYHDGDLTDQDKNSELWHELYNIQHRIQSFSFFTQTAYHQFQEESERLIEPLIHIRPDKGTDKKK